MEAEAEAEKGEQGFSSACYAPRPQGNYGHDPPALLMPSAISRTNLCERSRTCRVHTTN